MPGRHKTKYKKKKKKKETKGKILQLKYVIFLNIL